MNRAISLALALRDFFYSANTDALRAAWASLPGAAELPVSAIQELEYEFNRFFIGPAAPLAPPFASVYLEREPVLMGRSTLDVRALYKALGLSVPECAFPDDFIGYELEAWLILRELEQSCPGPELAAASDWLAGHLRAWLPLFLAKLRAGQPSPALGRVASLLEEWLAESARYRPQSERRPA